MSVGGGVVTPEFVEMFVFVKLTTIPSTNIVLDDNVVIVVFSSENIIVVDVVVVTVVEEKFKESVLLAKPTGVGLNILGVVVFALSLIFIMNTVVFSNGGRLIRLSASEELLILLGIDNELFSFVVEFSFNLVVLLFRLTGVTTFCSDPLLAGVRDAVRLDEIDTIVVVVVELSNGIVTFGGMRTFSVAEVLLLVVGVGLISDDEFATRVVLSSNTEDVSLILIILNGVVVELVELLKAESGEEFSPKMSPSNG